MRFHIHHRTLINKFYKDTKLLNIQINICINKYGDYQLKMKMFEITIRWERSQGRT